MVRVSRINFDNIKYIYFIFYKLLLRTKKKKKVFKNIFVKNTIVVGINYEDFLHGVHE